MTPQTSPMNLHHNHEILTEFIVESNCGLRRNKTRFFKGYTNRANILSSCFVKNEAKIHLPTYCGIGRMSPTSLTLKLDT